jgi:hypothetical protein
MVPAIFLIQGRPERSRKREEMRNGAREPALEDLQREFPDWAISTDRDFTGFCFAYRQSGSATLSGEDPAKLREQIRGWLGRHDELD